MGTSPYAGPPAGVQELLTSTWIFWTWPTTVPGDLHLVYITSVPEDYQATAALLVEQLGSSGIPRPLALRLARDPQTVGWLNTQPDWTGKAVTSYQRTRDEALAFAQAADAWLAGKGWHGPPALRARPFGGRSGMVFLRTADASSFAGTGARPSRLAALLGDN